MRSFRTPTLVAPLVLAASASACTGTVVASESDADTSSVHTLLVVEQSTPATVDELSRSQVSVWFLRAADEQTASDATRLVTDVLELPEEGTCVAMGPAPSREMPARLTPIELAFAGDVHVEAGASRADLAVRAFPDVAGLVSGVLYTARSQNGLDLSSDRLLRLRVSGAGELVGFDASVEAPLPPSGVAVDGVAASSAEASVRRAQPFHLSWTAVGADDVVYVDVMPMPGSTTDRVRCAAPDNGHLQIPAFAVPEADKMILSVHRVRDAALRTDSGEMGTAHFDLAVTARVSVAGQ